MAATLLNSYRYSAAGGGGLPNHNWEVHYDATVGVYNAGTTDATNGQTIATWADQSGNGNDLLGASAPYRPTYDSSAFGGLGGIDLVAKHFTVTNSIDLFTGNPVWTAFHVIHRNGNSLWSLEGGSGLSGTGVIYGDGNFYAGAPNTNRYIYRSHNNTIGSNIYTVQASTSGVDDSKLWINGVQKVPIAYASAAKQACIYFGRRSSNTGGEASNGLYGEFLLTRSALTETEIEEIETYLSEKWGLPIT